jgi:5'-3' exonuclease
MGVPGFFLWLMKNYKKEGFVFQKEKLIKKDVQNETDNLYIESLLNEINAIDYFLIDANCLIHPVCFKTVLDNPDLVDQDMLEEKMFINIIGYLNKIINYVDPKKGVYLAIDGVAPIAKIKQQRLRRFKSIADRTLWDNIKKKHNKPLGNYWNNSAITPGTIFMEKLNNKLLEWMKTLNRKVIYSSCFTPEEGEHKLLQFIRQNQKKKVDYSYVFYGLDADLIFLSLSTEKDNIYLLREATEINKKVSTEILNYVSIKIMRQAIVNTILRFLIKVTDNNFNKESVYSFDNINKNRLVNDFIFMCYFLGNDFLPHIPSLDIHKNGIENLIINYVETMNELIIEKNEIEYLLANTKVLRSKSLTIINLHFLSKFINRLALQEEEVLKENFLKGKRMLRCDGDAYEKELFKIDNLQFKIHDPIQLGSDSLENGRFRYYQYYWGITKDNIEEFSERLVKNYLCGIKWVTLYYFNKCPSWDWYYPFDYPPFISDISKYLLKNNINKIKFKLGEPITPFIQLLAVLPPQSYKLLPNSLANLVTDSNSPLAYMYPEKFQQDFINKKKYWMAIPKLPPLDIDQIKTVFLKYKNKLKKDELNRNEFIEVYKINVRSKNKKVI